jgi:HD-GYP domain-containing protein (c-di-GMP phosphodiesterase class II)
MRLILHYLASLILLVLYGVRVCPFLETLTPLQLGGPIAVALAVQWSLQLPLRRWLVDSQPYEKRVRRRLIVEFGLFLTSGVMLMLFNMLYYGAPLESGLKVLIGFAVAGFFISVDLALEHERQLTEHFRTSGETLPPTENCYPVSRKLATFAAVSAIVVTTVLFLVVNKDLHWLLDVSGKVTLMEAQVSILKEFLYVSLVILGYVLLVIRSYTRNLHFFFEIENDVLMRTNGGDLSGRVPVSTNDEFGVMAHHTNRMVDAIRERTEEIQRTRDVTIYSLASLAETRDNETGAHILRTQHYVLALAEQLADHPRFRDTLDEETIQLLHKSAPLHDIGKVGIPDAILLKPGKLTDEEFETMKGHAQLGGDAIRVAEKELGGNSFLRYAREIAESHHEKWNGSGYPRGLSGDDIPLSGRLMALADVYDALISKRVYKPAFSHDKAKGIILEGKGQHFDPDVVEAFLAVEPRFQAIATRYRDEDYSETSQSNE